MKKKHSKAQIDYLASREHFLQISNQADKRIAELKEEGERSWASRDGRNY
ncbi:hypothetical protein [Paenibacillus sp. V4I7]|nr:hypothetical protein [Paenibacillus sp. V4I7]MDQ0901509.1 hypothetical protein [Paenibacillus sp. V4I7]